MPLLNYFTTVGLLLTVLLLLIDAMREPSSAAIRETRREANLPKPKIYSRVGERAVNVPQTTIALATQAPGAPADVPRPLSESSAEPLVAAAPESSASDAAAAPDTAQKAKPRRKAAKVRTRRQHNELVRRYPETHPGYLSYAQERHPWPFSPQTNPRPRLPQPFAQGGVTRPSFAQGGGRWN